ncbi:aspartate-semialdehyde dehydrogenase [bacterium]|jgi:aspartate-semialdehyde dehydrogenase|nr:aspartate-semialdehyde dehydrogenase [Gemmatimonadota bacterium]MCH2665549.1 aspartate-semialdehyde dehydrogenase [bacterium]HCK12375.1 aspartate-semialdehyde dehydrogenase [Candidatus Latescibacterota bacterium]
MSKLRVGVLGATGMVGQRFITILADHAWFEPVEVAASPRSAGKTYQEAVDGRWTLSGTEVPESVADLVVRKVSNVDSIVENVDFVVSALDMDKEEIRALENSYARRETPVVSNNSAHRWTPDVPMIIPEINPDHADVIPAQRKRLGTTRGFVSVKPNCSIQPYVPAFQALWDFGPTRASVCTYQALSGAGKTPETYPEMADNVIPFIGGEEEKSADEPLKIWGHISNGEIVKADSPVISAQCVRVPVTDGHLAATSVSFEKKPTREDVIARWNSFQGNEGAEGLPSAPSPFVVYRDEDDRPQTRLDRDFGNGMGITIGRLREDNVFDYKFVALSHNTVRGAAGGAILMAELLKAQGYIEAS